MDISLLLRYLRCSICEAPLTTNQGNAACGSGHLFPIKDGKVFIIQPYGNIQPTLRKGAKNQAIWTAWRHANHRYYAKELAAHPDQSVVLDFGTGQGQFGDLMARFPHLVRADFFPYADANTIYDLTLPLPFPDRTFDLIIASNVFEHLPDATKVLAECVRALKPGGRILATIPFLLQVHQEPYDFHRYTYIMLERLLTQAGFEEVQTGSLTTEAETYLHTQRHFFQAQFAEDHGFGLKLFWASQRLLNRLYPTIWSKSPIHKGFTLGYGFSGSLPRAK